MLLCFFGCKEKKTAVAKKSKLQPTLVTAVSKPQTESLYFKGNLSPISTTIVKSPVDGRIKTIFAIYGEEVTKGEKLASIQPVGLEEKFRTAVTDYLQRKASLEQQRTTYEGDKELYKAGAMSKEAFENSSNSYRTALLNLNQSRYQLQKILSKVGVSLEKIEKLSLKQIQEVNVLLSQKMEDSIVDSPMAGVVLIPKELKSESGSSKQGGIEVGNNTTELQPLFSIGDPTGYKIDISISEINIIEIKEGLKAVITGDAFPGITLYGTVHNVSVQASPGQSGSFSLYPATVDVPNVPDEQRKKIRIGMTVKVQVQIQKPAEVMVPIAAVVTKKGQSYVTLVDKTGKQKQVAVETGPTTITEVVIISGVNNGDKVVVNPQGDTDVHAETD